MNVERLLNLMLHSRQKRELPFWTGEITVVLRLGVEEGWGVCTGWEPMVGVALFDRWDDSTASCRISGTGDRVREGALVGDMGRGELADGDPVEGDPSPAEGLPFTSGDTGEVVPLLACPLMPSLCTWETGLSPQVGVEEEEVAVAPSLGLRLGLRLTVLPDWGRASCGG